MDHPTHHRSWGRLPTVGFLLVAASSLALGAIASVLTPFQGLKGGVIVVEGSTFVVRHSGLLQDPVGDVVSVGSSKALAIEMNPQATNIARTAIQANDWFYQVRVMEYAADTIPSGTFRVQLYANGVSKGALFMTQGVADDVSQEGVTFRWDIDSGLQPDVAYFVKVIADD